MARSEQVRPQDAMVEASLALSRAASVQVRLDHQVVKDIDSVVRRRLNAQGEKSRLEVMGEEGADLYGLAGIFWNAHQAQLTDRKPYEISLSDVEIEYIGGILAKPHDDLTPQEAESLGIFKSAAEKALAADREKPEKRDGNPEKGPRSAWWDLRW